MSVVVGGRKKSSMFVDSNRELRRLSRASVSVLLKEELDRYSNKRNLIFPEAPDLWDSFWIGLLVIFVFSVIPGLCFFASRSFPLHWLPTNESMTFENLGLTMDLYRTSGYGIVTPLSRAMPSYFFVHVCAGSIGSALLVFMFTTGRVLRWRLADGTVSYDSAKDLHKIVAFWSSLCWTVVIVTGAITIPLLHPVLQVANYAELAGVLLLLIGTLISAYLRQWVFHRLCAWGLVYSATASVFVGMSGRSLQAFTGMSAYEIKAIGYTVAFLTPIVGLARDLYVEISKLSRDNEDMILSLAKKSHKRVSESSVRRFAKEMKPFKAARSDKMRMMSLYQHVMKAEPLEAYIVKRHSSSVYKPWLDRMEEFRDEMNEEYEKDDS
eukprot:scaffold75209_cov29-Attheya_sp.AAC.1